MKLTLVLVGQEGTTVTDRNPLKMTFFSLLDSSLFSNFSSLFSLYPMALSAIEQTTTPARGAGVVV